MATIRVRFESGDSGEWELHDRMPLVEFVNQLYGAMVRGCLFSFGVASRESEAIVDYGMVGLRMSEVASWEVDGLVHHSALIGP
jgi:hypothetical protein